MDPHIYISDGEPLVNEKGEIHLALNNTCTVIKVAD